MTGSEIVKRMIRIRKTTSQKLAEELGISKSALSHSIAGAKSTMSVDWLVEALYCLGCEVVVRPFEGLLGDMKTEWVLTPGSEARTKRINAVAAQLKAKGQSDNLSETEEYVSKEMNKRIKAMEKAARDGDARKMAALPKRIETAEDEEPSADEDEDY